MFEFGPKQISPPSRMLPQENPSPETMFLNTRFDMD